MGAVSIPPDIQLYRFDEFELDGDSLELRRRGQVVPLRPQAAKVLRLLLQNAGRLVSRDDIRDQVWGPQTDVDFDHSLHTAIRQVRAALGESGDDARLIQTYPRRGYRFEAAVEVEQQSSGARAATPEAAAADVEPMATARGRSWRVPLAAAATVAVLAIAWSWLGVLPAADAVTERVAVAPFRVLSGGEVDQEFGDGLYAELTGAFDRVSDEHTLVVAQPLGLSPAQQQEHARSQEVDLLLSGTIRSADGTARVTAQLLRVTDGVQIWAGTFEGSLDDELQLQQQLADRIAAAVHDAIHASRP